MVGMTPRRSGPAIGSRAAIAASVTDSSEVSAVRARSTSSRPSGVKTTWRPAARSRMWQSSCRSSASSPADNVDCVTAQVWAARPKWRLSARATR